MNWVSSPIGSINIKTTGLNPVEDRIVHIAILRFESGKRWSEMEAWTAICGSDVPVEADAILAGGIDPRELEGKPPIEDLMGSIVDILGGMKIYLAYNAPFCLDFLREAHRRSGCEDPLPFTPKNVIDPLIFARHLYARSRGWRLAQMAARLGVVVDRDRNALRDAMAAAEVMVRMAVTHDLPSDLSGLITLQDKYRLEWEERL